ncbi:response regulator transcription factor [Parablastomonas sp. CN1-191]|uniref:response regulator transcription factor n=1 Tax=Parablastomonas sp. CN1-191 TaxID=3400908 RepID=UPI003BF8678E
MARRHTILLVDSNTRRRAAISHCLVGSHFHVEPFEDLDEIGARWPREGVILVYNDDRPVRDLLERMTSSGRWLPVLAFSEEPNAHKVVEAVLDGALDYLVWPFDGPQLDQALERAEHSDSAVGNARLREARARSRLRRLTPREREVLTGVARGLSNRQIGEELAISPRTVEIHRANMLSKIGAAHTSEAIRVAVEAALVD